jgi:hypothetical protein
MTEEILIPHVLQWKNDRFVKIEDVLADLMFRMEDEGNMIPITEMIGYFADLEDYDIPVTMIVDSTSSLN